MAEATVRLNTPPQSTVSVARLDEPARRRLPSVRYGLMIAVAGLPIIACAVPSVAQQASPQITRTPEIPPGVAEQIKLHIPSVILAEPARETALAIFITMREQIPNNSLVRIRGLPASATLSEGHAIAPGAWAVPIAAVPRLRVSLPADVSGKSEVTLLLVTVDGHVLAEAKTALVVGATARLIAPDVLQSPPAERPATVATPAPPPALPPPTVAPSASMPSSAAPSPTPPSDPPTAAAAPKVSAAPPPESSSPPSSVTAPPSDPPAAAPKAAAVPPPLPAEVTPPAPAATPKVATAPPAPPSPPPSVTAPSPSDSPAAAPKVAAVPPPPPAEVKPPEPAASPKSTVAAIPPSAVTPPPAATPPPLSAEARSRAMMFVTRGTALLGEGNIAGARNFFERAADAGLPEGAAALGMTYDPHELARLKVHGLRPDVARARLWYEKARDLGSTQAAEILARLGY